MIDRVGGTPPPPTGPRATGGAVPPRPPADAAALAAATVRALGGGEGAGEPGVIVSLSEAARSTVSGSRAGDAVLDPRQPIAALVVGPGAAPRDPAHLSEAEMSAIGRAQGIPGVRPLPHAAAEPGRESRTLPPGAYRWLALAVGAGALLWLLAGRR